MDEAVFSVLNAPVVNDAALQREIIIGEFSGIFGTAELSLVLSLFNDLRDQRIIESLFIQEIVFRIDVFHIQMFHKRKRNLRLDQMEKLAVQIKQCLVAAEPWVDLHHQVCVFAVKQIAERVFQIILFLKIPVEDFGCHAGKLHNIFYRCRIISFLMK